MAPVKVYYQFPADAEKEKLLAVFSKHKEGVTNFSGNLIEGRSTRSKRYEGELPTVTAMVGYPDPFEAIEKELTDLYGKEVHIHMDKKVKGSKKVGSKKTSVKNKSSKHTRKVRPKMTPEKKNKYVENLTEQLAGLKIGGCNSCGKRKCNTRRKRLH